jgi:hypothetical protein
MKRFALLSAAVACVFGLAVHEAQAIPPGGLPLKPLPEGPKQPIPPKVNPWKLFSGNTAVMVVDPFLPLSPKKTVATLNLRSSLNSLFDANTADIRNTFLTKLADKKLTGYRLYNTKVSIGSSSNASLQLAVFNSKSFGLRYVVPGNQIDCRIDIPWAPDHSMRVRFSLELTMILDTSRGGVALASATMRMTNVKVDIGSSLLFDSAAQARKAQAAFSAQNIDARRNVQGGIALVNAKLQSYLSNPMVSVSYNSGASQLVLTLSPSRLVAK